MPKRSPQDFRQIPPGPHSAGQRRPDPTLHVDNSTPFHWQCRGVETPISARWLLRVDAIGARPFSCGRAGREVLTPLAGAA